MIIDPFVLSGGSCAPSGRSIPYGGLRGVPVYRLNIGHREGVAFRPPLAVDIALDRYSDQTGDWVLGRFGQFTDRLILVEGEVCCRQSAVGQ